MTTYVHALPTFGNERLYGSSGFQGRIASSKQNSSAAKPIISGLFATLLLGSGTGATFDMHNFDEWFTYVKDRSPVLGEMAFQSESKTHVDATPDLRSAEEHLVNVRNVIGLPMSELAKELNVTRQALYKWLSAESQPDSPEKVEHIKRLSIIADLFSANELSNGKSLVKIRAFDGDSLLDVIKTSPDWFEKAKTLVNEAVAMKDAARNSGIMGSKAESSSDWLASESISGAFDRNTLG
ncbi:hypothetical protein ACRW6W_01620 [Escherichia coli]|nr:helix-turn-helix transcriptional regulator [Escherichia coli]